MTGFVLDRYTQTLAANQEMRVNILANEFRVIAALWPLTVHFLQGGRIVGTASAMLAGDYSRGMEFDGFIVKNGATAQNVQLGVSNGNAGSDRITGQVEVIDGGKSRVIVGKSFIDTANCPVDAAKLSLIGLLNPVGSSQNVFINQIFLSVEGAVAGRVLVRQHDTILTNEVTATQSLSKKNGDIFGGAHKLSYENNVAALGAGWSGRYYLSQTAPPVMIRYTEPICLTPGNGILITSELVNMSVTGIFEGYEESAT